MNQEIKDEWEAIATQYIVTKLKELAKVEVIGYKKHLAILRIEILEDGKILIIV
jgi:hypothetical protein